MIKFLKDCKDTIPIITFVVFFGIVLCFFSWYNRVQQKGLLMSDLQVEIKGEVFILSSVKLKKTERLVKMEIEFLNADDEL